MAISRLMVRQLRNLNSVDIFPSPQVNLIYGENGSGKTSVLEAIYLLGMGRSFRSLKHKAVIQRDTDHLSVFARLQDPLEGDIPLGLQRAQDGAIHLKARGQRLHSVAELASFLPVQVIDAEAFLLLEGSPRLRRQFLDWLVFHVELGFYPAWRDCQKCLKHRNTLLRRDRIDAQEVAVWDQELIRLTEQIHEYRKAQFEAFRTYFFSLVDEFISLEGLKLSYYCGWEKDKTYAEALASHWLRDQQQGFTQVGSHRADLRISLNGQNAAEVLSRGQQKLLVCALKIAQGLMFQEQQKQQSQLQASVGHRKCVFLVDDLPAELDERHRKRLISWLNKMETQVFITGVEADSLEACWSDEIEGERFVPSPKVKKFHVELGRVTEIEIMDKKQETTELLAPMPLPLISIHT